MTFETCVKFHCTCSCCRTWRQRGALEKFVQMCPMYVHIHVSAFVYVWLLVFPLLGYHLGFLGRHSPSSWGNSWNVFVDKHDHESFHVSSEGSELAKCLFRFICIRVYICMYLCGYMYFTHVYVVHYSVFCSLLLLLFFGFLLRFLWFVCDFHASFRLVCVRSLLGYASNTRTDTHTHTRTQSYVLISCPFTSLYLSLSLGLSHNLRDASFGFALGLATAYTHNCSFCCCFLCRCSSCHSPNMDGGRENRHPAACFTDKHA